MASDEMPDAAFTHTVRGFFGEELTIAAYAPVDAEDGGAVEFRIRDERGRTASAHISSPDEREALALALSDACAAVGTDLAELLDRAAMAGQPGDELPAPVHLPSGGGVPPVMSDGELRDEQAAAAGAARASRDAREAWNDPDGEA